jgi:uncharacterized membrane protein
VPTHRTDLRLSDARKDDVVELDMSVEDALKYLI